MMVLLDVASLFTNIPKEMALKEIRHSVENGPSLSQRTMIPTKNIMNLVDLGLDTYLQFDGEKCEQIKGTLIGSSLSCLLVDIFTKQLEAKALKPSGLFRVSDTCTMHL